ncbi:MAG TPA: ribonuclease HI, partial [Chloroflexi bacterium]|nr:ribonuclease HI [Chloroflexota bacterium]
MGPGGWGVLLIYNGTEKEIYGGELETTNNRMELTAVIMGIESLTSPCEIAITTDSKYVMDGITEWMKGWKKRNWKTASKKPVKNK